MHEIISEDGTVQRQISLSSVLPLVLNLEKKTFPKSEAMDAAAEIKKPNTSIWIMTQQENRSQLQVMGYVVFARVGASIGVHKVCVDPQRRRKGIGGKMIARLIARARTQHCSSIWLWIDANRLAARGLYEKFGFVQDNVLEDYYGPGRTGIHMALSLV